MHKQALNVISKCIEDQIQRVETGTFTIKIPTINSLKMAVPKMEYHLTPEMFIQIDNSSTIIFPHEEIVVDPGEICLIPAMMPHLDTSRYPSRPFLNIVAMFQEKTFSLHTATERRLNCSDVYTRDLFFFESYHLRTLENCLNDTVIFYHKQDCQTAVKGMMLASLAIMDNAIKNIEVPQRVGNFHIIKCLDLIKAYYLNPSLNVKFLAQQLNLSPDYLSNLFTSSQEITLTEYINRMRINTACKYLKNSNLTISEISRACGYRDPAYFARIFRKRFDMSPQQYRNE